MNRYLTFTFAIALAGTCALQAQSSNPLSTELKQMYTGLKNNLTKMAEKMPEENYSFKATPDVRSFGQLIAHVAGSQARTCSAVNGEQKTVDTAEKTSKADLVAALKESFTICDTAYDSLTDAAASEMIKTARGQRSKFGALAANVSHSNEEYGYMSVYMRLKGVVPPSSEKR
ncbi:MAG: DinB family protein [Bryobacteraceae bacterium]